MAVLAKTRSGRVSFEQITSSEMSTRQLCVHRQSGGQMTVALVT